MNKLIKQAFTLIELLVVIAIIGILSGLIVVAMNGTTQKANIAKAQVFSSSLKNSLMSNLVSEWNFNNITDYDSGTRIVGTLNNNIPDTWGSLNYNHGTASGGPVLKDEQDCISNQCLSFDGIDDNVVLNNPTSLYPSPDMVISLWLKPVSLTKSEELFGKYNSGGGAVRNWTYGFWLYSTGNIGFGIGDGTNYNFSSSISTLSINVWYNIVVNYSGTNNLVKYYVNGQYMSGKNLTLSVSPRLTTNSYTIGGDQAGSFFTGLIDEVRIYNTTMSTSQIQEQYYIGLNKLLTNGGITEKEYRNKINQLAINE